MRSEQLNSRIEILASLVRPGHALFDMCCDHGLIGFAALPIASRVVFVDQSANALRAVKERRLGLSAADQARTEVVVSPGELVSVASYGPSDFIIAGVGVTTIVSIVSALFPQGLEGNRLILSPQQDSLPLRWFLREKGYGLVDERVTIERKRYREVLVIEAQGAAVEEAFLSERDEVAREYKAWLKSYRDSIATAKSH